MMTQVRNYLLLTVLCFLSVTSMVFAQEKKERASPPAKATGKVAGANISIIYSSPAVRGRVIWGDLVPYGVAWRAGANEATTFITDKDIMVEGKPLKAGKYSIFAVPDEEEWKIIFNTHTGQWGANKSGAANFDPENNALVVTVQPKKTDKMYERLVYDITDKGFSVKWENMEVPVRIK